MKMKKVDTITMDILRSIKPGMTVVYQLPSAAKMLSGTSNACRAGKLLECKFTCSSNYNERTLTITREF